MQSVYLEVTHIQDREQIINTRFKLCGLRQKRLKLHTSVNFDMLLTYFIVFISFVLISKVVINLHLLRKKLNTYTFNETCTKNVMGIIKYLVTNIFNWQWNHRILLYDKSEIAFRFF